MQFAKCDRQTELAYRMAWEPSHRFTKKEDRVLEQLVAEHGMSSWGPIAV
jgi:hypothetical protein